MPRVFSFTPYITEFKQSSLAEDHDLHIGKEGAYSSLSLYEKKDVTSKSFSNVIAKQRQKVDFLSVHPESNVLASRCVGDRRVDAVGINIKSNPRLFGRRFFKRCEREGTILEIDITPLLSQIEAKELRKFYRCTRDIIHTGVPVLLTQKIQKITEARKYRDLQTIAEIHGIARKNTSIECIIERLSVNKAKREGQILSDNVEVIL